MESRIDEDERGRDLYTEKINELVKSLSISEEYKKIDDQINKLNKETDSARGEIKQRNRFTEFLFDKMYFLIGFENIMNDYSIKVDNLRQEKDRVRNEELSKYAVEKLELENGAISLPAGTPSPQILEEMLRDKICKICGEPLTEKAKGYINKSIKLYNESKNSKTGIKAPIVFPNNFIDEFQIIDRTFQLHPEKYSKDRIEDEIQFDIKRISERNEIIINNANEIELKEKAKKEILANVPNLSEDELKNSLTEHAKYMKENNELVRKIGDNAARLEQKVKDLQELKQTRNKTLSQFRESNFKKYTVDLLEDLSNIGKVVKDKEYDNFLKKLSDKATQYLKQINVGEITGKIKLHKKGEEVKFLSVNEDDTERYDLENSGALQISIPLSILFAIADIATETVDNESYPMIFDAPTGRFSPDRERAFFKVLKETKKQRIVVTKQFLDGDENENIPPYVKQEEFQKIERAKAFFIKRARPFDKNDKATIDSQIEEIK